MPRPSRSGSYLLCATPRTGSTLLCGLLRSSGVAGRPESYFRLPDEPSWAARWQLRRDPAGSYDYRDYVRAALQAGRTDNGVFGARVMWGTMDDLVAKLWVAYRQPAGEDLDLLTRAFGPTRFVHLWRGDTVAQAVSWARAEQTGYWHHGDTVASEPRFDFDRIHGLVRTIDEHNAAWRDWFTFSGVRPHVVRYEELAADAVGVTRGVLDFLGQQPSGTRNITAADHRQADDLSSAWIARYRNTG